MATVDDPIVGGTPVVTPGQARSYLLRQSGRVLSEQGVGEVVDAFWKWGPIANIRPDVAFAQACHETRGFRFGGQVRASQHNVGGIGATNDGAAGSVNPDWDTGALQFYVHQWAWLVGNDPARVPAGLRPHFTTAVDARIPAVASVRAVKGPTTTWRSLGGRWGVRTDVPWQQQATMPDNYGDRIERHYRSLLEEPKEDTRMVSMRQFTDEKIAQLRARGRDVTDLRGRLPVNRDPANRYGPLANGLASVEYIIHHYTGDRFLRATIKAIVGTDYGLDRISERMSAADEVDLITWYANYHIGRDGGDWGGIAYHVMVLPSGRIYVNWDIGLLTYHAFAGGNRRSVAVCCPSSFDQDPTPAQLVALNHVWWVLCEESPEIPAGHGQLIGHKEAVMLDRQNQTACPGKFLDHVRRYRESGQPTVALDLGTPTPAPAPAPAPPPAPAENPHALEIAIPGTDQSYWILDPILSFWREKGGIEGCGYPLEGMVGNEDDSIRSQVFDNVMIEWYVRDGKVRLGGLGQRYKALKDAA